MHEHVTARAQTWPPLFGLGLGLGSGLGSGLGLGLGLGWLVCSWLTVGRIDDALWYDVIWYLQLTRRSVQVRIKALCTGVEVPRGCMLVHSTLTNAMTR